MKPVLLVEDDPGVLEAVRLVLELHGYLVISARNGRDALAYLHSHPKELGVILLDLMMPVMDGFTFLAEQAKNRELVGVPVVVMSAGSGFEARLPKNRDLSRLAKPVDLDELLGVVARFCGEPGHV